MLFNWMRGAQTPLQRQRDLSRRLRKLERLFPLQDILGERLDAQKVQAYYSECHAAYRKHHSSEGATHMALNESGRFDPDGFREHLRRIEARWAQKAPGDVLELGFGQGFNLGWLAPRHKGTRFHGIDLTPDHLALAQQRMQAAGTTNVQLQLGDMQRLPQADGSIDEAFAIEAFCHAPDTSRALAEVARVLRPGGRFTLFDGYQLRPTGALDADGAMAVQLAARGAAVNEWQVADELVAAAAAQGLAVAGGAQFVARGGHQRRCEQRHGQLAAGQLEGRDGALGDMGAVQVADGRLGLGPAGGRAGKSAGR